MIPELCAPGNAQGNGSSLSVECELMAGPCCNFRDCATTVRSATYLTMVSLTLEYASTVWDPRKQEDTQQLEKVQHWAARYACNNFTDRTPGTVQSQRYRAPRIIQSMRCWTPGSVWSQRYRATSTYSCWDMGHLVPYNHWDSWHLVPYNCWDTGHIVSRNCCLTVWNRTALNNAGSITNNRCCTRSAVGWLTSISPASANTQTTGQEE